MMGKTNIFFRTFAHIVDAFTSCGFAQNKNSNNNNLLYDLRVTMSSSKPSRRNKFWISGPPASILQYRIVDMVHIRSVIFYFNG